MAKSQYYGRRGDEIKRMQTRLNELGAGLQVDGIWGDKTESAYLRLREDSQASGIEQGGKSSTGKQPMEGYQRLDVEAADRDEIEEKARAAIAGEYDAQSAMEDEKAERLRQQILKAIEQLDPRYNARLETLAKSYSGARDDLANQTTKRGIGRSSIYLEALERSHQLELADSESIRQQYQSELADLNEEIRQAETDLWHNKGLLSAQKEREIREYADDLAQQRNNLMVEAIKYNNTITQQERSYLASLEEGSGTSSAGRRSGRKRSSGKSGSTSTYTQGMSQWNSLNDAGKISFFQSYGKQIKEVNESLYKKMQSEYNRIVKSSKPDSSRMAGGVR